MTSAADIVWEHWRDGRRMAALPEPVRPRTRADGYAVQAALAGRSAHPLFGWKIAATSVAGQRHINVDGPLAGDGQHPAGPQPVDLLAQELDRADTEHDPAGQRVVHERGGGGHGARLIAERSREVKAAETRRVRHQRGYQTGRSASTLTQTDLGWVYSRIASKPISRP